MTKLQPETVLALSPVMPVVVIQDAAHAVPLARALLAGGIKATEITLRTAAALDCIRAIAREVPEMIVGAGTVLNEGDLNNAIEAGAAYALSPGATPALLEAGLRAPIPFFPGVATASEVMAVLDLGYRCMKFFPAEQLGGAAALKGLGGPLPNARFCPTGGITAATAPSYLALPNVLCVGGSWIAPSDRMKACDWSTIEVLAREASALRKT